MATLSQISPSTTVRVVAVGGDARLRQRLMEMGVLPGTPIRVVRLAPLGDPVDIEVRGYHLSLRKSEAGEIEVEASGESR